MGLASKMAAANANAGLAPAAGGAARPPPGPPPTSTYPGQSSYPGQQQPSYGQAPAPTSQYGQPTSQYGQQGSSYPGQQPQSSYPGQQPPQQQYSAPPGAPPSSTRPQSGQYGTPPGPPPRPQSGSYAPSQGAPYQQQSQYPGQQQPQYPGQQPQYPGQQSQYGQPPQAPQQQFGGSSADASFIQGILEQCVRDQNIQAFYPPGSLGPIAQRVAQSGALDRVCRDWQIQKEFGADLVKLCLFDTILYVDDSGSMAFEEGGERIDDLKLILNRAAYAAALFDQDGISVRFMNSQVNGDNIASEKQAEQLLQQVRFSGLTPLGTSMESKILQPLVLGPARAGRLQKPVLIITITDGAPAGEDRYKIVQVITNAVRELGRSRYGADAVSFQIAQVGNDEKAFNFLSELDNHPELGSLIDVTSNYELESAEMLRKSGQELTPSLWLIKLLMGAIDSSYDERDEK